MEYILVIIVGFSVGYTVMNIKNRAVEIYRHNQYIRELKELEEKLDARLKKGEVE